MVTMTETAVVMQAVGEEADSSPERSSAQALWEQVERAVRGAPPAQAAPRCEAVRKMAALHCRALCQKPQQSDIQELWAAEGDVEEFAGSAVVEPLKDIARHMTWGVQEESATGEAQVHLRTSSVANFNRTHELREQFLRPSLGEQRAEALWSMCQECAWEAYHTQQRHWSEADVHRLWADHFARRTAFDENPAPCSSNRAVVALCHHFCRHWTSANATDEELELRKAALDVATREAQEAAGAEVVRVVLDMQEELRRCTHLDRLADRKSPGQLVSNLLRNTSGQAKAAAEAAARVRDELLAPLLGGDRAAEVYWVCHGCSWHEQNRYDYESALAGRLTGSRDGYLRDAKADWASVMEHSVKMGFEAA